RRGDGPPGSTATGWGAGSVADSAATGGSTAGKAGGSAAAPAALPTGGTALAEAPALPLMIRSKFPMIELLELLSPSFEMWTFEIGAFTGEVWNCIPMSPNPPVLTCAS